MSEQIDHIPRRVRNELHFRPVEVISKTFIANSFYRVELGGDALNGFASHGFDDHIKVFFPDAETGICNLPEITGGGVVWKEGARPAARDYTPLFFNGIDRLTVDFYIHKSGLASDWAVKARPGDLLAIGGPRGSLIVPDDYQFQLYVCDESGLPAFLRRCQTMKGKSIRLYAFAEENMGRCYLGERPDIEIFWLGSGTMYGERMKTLMTELNNLALPAKDYFIWLTGEGAVVKQLSDYFIVERQLQPDFVRAVAYWHKKNAI
ncbi:siderophore-interacting protein [Erwinia tracheiphila]|uniref:FMN reductase n=1 Tax=Erwinia tracheiphila TaxID=65700 RepID=A0A0M2KCA9_9GAMM|nr:siderophore-interacting protein [Erwinia tracheiphila]EOS96948.1 siderophore-interacting protein [Erwinia tracheiphila PSU-1]KKF34631.1 FMN reductase [Erwinia tracheiphila]UIA86302.1 siderophore-interacting protein [Erwinia tracheiphila]UIA94620.1 siderophore-interacting protein [Erwinia tracheiphila]